ncbi:alpha/beta-type small acid-soluble spore protein [Tepidibacillus marianensis]|uniref:alpha/beta-type small acid-soluble spore protein n=1 Tax=Tepidibacillus marianensis TaxID=3131995 RepID=UPI0030CEF8AA
MSRRNRRTAVPGARPVLDQFKQHLLVQDGLIDKNTDQNEISYEVAKEIGVPLKEGYNGQLSTHDAGKVGGQIGGRMVKELIRMAQEQLVKERNGNL